MRGFLSAYGGRLDSGLARDLEAADDEAEIREHIARALQQALAEADFEGLVRCLGPPPQ